MRRTLFLLVVFMLVTAGLSAAQEDERANSLTAGSWALMFGISENFTLDPFTGGSLSVKRHFSDKSALRAGIDFGVGSSENTAENTATTPVQQTRNNDHRAFQLEGLYQRYTSPGRPINFYWGAGAYGGYSSRTREALVDSTFTRNETTSYSVGATGLLGVEFFAARAIGIHAEYRGNLGYSWSESVAKRERPGATPGDLRIDAYGWSFGGGYLRFGLSAYF
jgi:hypothetical protein